jgi:hypothetical protein
MRQVILISLVFISCNLFSQLDSLVDVYKQAKTDTSKVNRQTVCYVLLRMHG